MFGSATSIKNWNIFILGLGFFLVFTGYLTIAAISETVIRSYTARTGNSVNAFLSLGINAVTNAISAPFAPVFFRLFSRKTAFIAGSLLISMYVFCYINPIPALLYTSAAISGVGGTLVWVTLVPELNLNSTEKTLTRNWAIFFTTFRSGSFGGNLFVFFLLQGADFISEKMQLTISLAMGSITLLGALSFFLLKDIPDEIQDDSVPIKEACKDYWMAAWDMIKVKEVLLLLPTMAFIGFVLTFLQTVFSTCIGTTCQLNNPKELVGLSAMFIGAGEICATGLILLTSKCDAQKTRLILILSGSFIYFWSLMTCMFMFPDTCAMYESTRMSVWFPNKYVLLTAAFIIGFHDNIIQVSYNAIIGTLWKSERECAGVIVLGNIILSLTLASSYFYAPYMRIKYQVMILILSMISSLAGLLAIDLMMRHNKVLPIDNVHCVN